MRYRILQYPRITQRNVQLIVGINRILDIQYELPAAGWPEGIVLQSLCSQGMNAESRVKEEANAVAVFLLWEEDHLQVGGKVTRPGVHFGPDVIMGEKVGLIRIA